MESETTPAQSSTGILYKLHGIGNTNGDSPHMQKAILMTNQRQNAICLFLTVRNCLRI
jgi:hypothetical protein